MSNDIGQEIRYVAPVAPDDRETLIAYLYMKVRQEDWHGVSDAANDLREIDAKRAAKP